MLSASGKIYFAPSDAPQVLCIDPRDTTVEMLGPELDGNGTFNAGGVLAAIGKIYFAPYFAPHVPCIDPPSTTTGMFGTELDGEGNYCARGVFNGVQVQPPP